MTPTLVGLETHHTAAGRVASRTCPRCRLTGDWSAVHEHRSVRLLGVTVGRVGARDLVACRSCGCALPAGWREAQRAPSATPVPA